MQSDFFTSTFGGIPSRRWRRYWKLLGALDYAYDRRIAWSARRTHLASQKMSPQNILLTAVKVPGREKDLDRVIRALTRSPLHRVSVATTPMESRGKFHNINIALAGHDLSRFDWVMVVDDDISVPDYFLDRFIFLCWRHRLALAQPAHRFRSYATFSITARHWASTVRQTSFVEIGPVTLIHSDLFGDLIPFPALQYGWGLDVHWAEMAMRQGWRLGIVDATSISHLRPVARSYDPRLAKEEGEHFLISQKAASRRSDILGTNVRL